VAELAKEDQWVDWLGRVYVRDHEAEVTSNNYKCWKLRDRELPGVELAEIR
jgi:hypothetical protein